MKTIITAIALILTISFAGNASTVEKIAKAKSENVSVSNAKASHKAVKAKKASGKNHKHLFKAKKNK